MKLFDKVKLTTDKYKEEGVLTGDIGHIVEIYHRKNLPTGYDVQFSNSETAFGPHVIIVKKEDIEVIPRLCSPLQKIKEKFILKVKSK